MAKPVISCIIPGTPEGAPGPSGWPENGLVEFRLDGWPGDRYGPPAAPVAAGRIFTCRRVADGGRYDGSETLRAQLLGRCRDAAGPNDFIDVEWDSPLREWVRRYPGVKFVLSCHDLARTPPDLPRLLAEMAAWPARMFKIVTRAENWADVLRLRRLLEWAERSEVPLTAYATGPYGVPSRLLALAGGTRWMYLSRGAPLVPGMLTWRDWSLCYRAGRAGRGSRLFGVAGDPVGQSLSPLLHNWFIAASGRPDLYLPFPAPDLAEFLSVLPELGLSGLSVTVPHKEASLPGCAIVSEAAARIGAVNTLVPEGLGWRGENTDWLGFLRSLDGFVPEDRRRFLVLGAGGAARAVVYALLRRGSEVRVWNRSPERLARLRRDFPEIRPVTSGVGLASDVVVNATAAAPRDGVPFEGLDRDRLRAAFAVDLNYGTGPAPFPTLARERGWPYQDGFTLLFHQAVEQQALWTGTRPTAHLEEAEALRCEWVRENQPDGDGSTSV